ncbi:MFS transporter [Arthrobacter sp. SA17]
MSALAGAATVGGSLFGTVIGGLTSTTQDGYVILGMTLLITGSAYVICTRDGVPAQHRITSPSAEKGQTPPPKDHLKRAYWRTFLSRFMLVLSYFFISGFGLYLLRDYISVGDGSIQDASQALVVGSTAGTVALLVFSAMAGLLADRFGYIRLLIATGCGLFVPAGLALILFPTFPAFVIAQLLIGAGFGFCGTAHQVAVTQVLPESANTGRDLGIMGIANAGPQVIAPSIGGMIITGTQNYAILFGLSIAFAILAAAIIICTEIPKAMPASAA